MTIKKGMKRTFLLTLVVILLVVTGCTTTEKEVKNKGKKKDVTLTIMAPQDYIQDAEMELGQRFTEETGTKVDYQIIPTDQYFNLLLTRLNTGDATDIFCSQAGSFDIVSQINVEKNAVNLTEETWTTHVDVPVLDELSVDGQVYGQPIQDLSTIWAVVYNKNIFKELSLDVPTTYDEFAEVCDVIQQNGITPIYEAVSDGWHHVLWFPEMGGQIEKLNPGFKELLNNNEATFYGNETSTLIINQIKDMVDKGYWGDNYLANSWSDAAKRMASGEYAMVLAQQGFVDEVLAVDNTLSVSDFGFFVAPLADNQFMNINPVGPSRFVYSGSENTEEAKAYLAFMAREESVNYMIDQVSRFNTMPYDYAKSVYTQEAIDFSEKYSEQGVVYQSVVKYVNPQWMEMGKELVAVITDQQTVEDMLKNIDKNRASQAESARDANWK